MTQLYTDAVKQSTLLSALLSVSHSTSQMFRFENVMKYHDVHSVAIFHFPKEEVLEIYGWPNNSCKVCQCGEEGQSIIYALRNKQTSALWKQQQQQVCLCK